MSWRTQSTLERLARLCRLIFHRFPTLRLQTTTRLQLPPKGDNSQEGESTLKPEPQGRSSVSFGRTAGHLRRSYVRSCRRRSLERASLFGSTYLGGVGGIGVGAVVEADSWAMIVSSI